MNKKTIILLAFILAKFIFQYNLISSEYDLQRDEYLHLDQANHLSWGYLSIPPVTSWISLIIKFLGNSEFWVKFFPALIGALTILVVWKTIETLKGSLFAQILGAFCILFSALLRLNTLFQPNSLDVLIWTLFYFAIIKYFVSENIKWFYLAGVIFAIGFLNKYNFVFLLIGIFPALLLSESRKIFTKKEFYYSLLLALVLISPNLYWQFSRSFPVFYHLKQLSEIQLVHVQRLDFFKGQLLFFINSLPIIILSFYALLFYKPFLKFRFFLYSIIITLGVFSYFKAKDYYAIGIYPIYIAFGSVYVGEILKNGWKKYLQPLSVFLVILIFIPILFIAFPNRSPKYIVENSKPYAQLGLLRWEDGENHEIPQDFADMLGWKELANKVEIVFDNLPSNENTIILCDNYGQAGAINYYSKNKKIKAVSFNADYINWFELDKKIDNLIRVKEFEDSKNELKETSPFFEKSVLIDSISNPLAREYRTAIFLFTKPKVDINLKLKNEVSQRKIRH